jgi:hypothetical protein
MLAFLKKKMHAIQSDVAQRVLSEYVALSSSDA